jgi:tRNA-Thr(GGU) m(6)t(6)A37 methyltransferase TsaA
MQIVLASIGTVQSPRKELIDDDWGNVISSITLDPNRFTPEALVGLSEFSHIEVIFYMHKVNPERIHLGARHPRNRTDWPRVGIFAQRAKNRPNPIGVTCCRLLEIDGLTITVQGLDAVDGTPVLDIKPYVREFAPREETIQPAWISELMAGYWEKI